jgi:O-antigen/teichoic acid export membrane protein
MKNKIILFIEQSLFSLNNFLLILFLSHFLIPLEFKKWALLNLLIMLSVGLNNIIINQPFQVFISKYYKNYLYQNYILVLHFIIIINSIIFSFLSVFISIPNKPLNISLSFFMILLLSLFELHRRILIHKTEIHFLLLITFLLVTILNFILTLTLNKILFTYSEVYLLIITFLALLILFSSTKIIKLYNITFYNLISKYNFYPILYRHFNFSKSLIIGIFFYWIYTQGFLLWLEDKLTLNEFNSLRVILNFLNFSTILLLLFDNYYITKQSQIYKEDKKKFIIYFKSLLLKFISFYIVYMISFFIIAWLIFDYIYPQYLIYKEYLIYLLFAQLIYGLSRPCILFIKVLEKNIYILLSHIIVALILVTTSQILIKYYGFIGVIYTVVISYSVFTIILYIFYFKLKKELS